MKQNRIKTFLKLFNQGFGQYKFQIAILVVLGFLTGLLEAVGINAIIPLFSFIAQGQETGTDIISRAIRWFFEFVHLPFNLPYLLGFIIGMFLLKGLAKIVFNAIQIKIIADFEKRTSAELYQKTMQARWPYLLRQKIGYLAAILQNDIGQNTYLLKYISQIILLATGLIMYTFVAINISPVITFSAFALGGLMFLLMKRFVYKTRLVSQAYANLNKEISHFINEHMLGIKTIKAMNSEKPIVAKGFDYFERMKNLRVRNFYLQNTTTELIAPVGMVFIALAFAYTYKTPGFNLASFAVIIYMIEKIFAYLQNAQMKMHNINEFIPYLKSVVEYKNSAIQGLEEDSGRRQFKFARELAVSNLEFAYGEEKILDKVNFVLRKGEMVGLIGPSGAGKTTLVDILLRLFEPQNGEILLDAVNIKEISLKEWRRHIGYVSQDIFLMNDTIENNIRFYDSFISKKQIEAAAKMANIYQFIKEQPKRFETSVGERGLLLSAGQRQRIILARVLARNPQILILDEATSSLDNESEVAIQKAIEDLKGKTTVLVIAHRLSTIINVDNLLVLEDGKISEQGPPQNLLADQNSYFFKVYNIRENAQ